MSYDEHDAAMDDMYYRIGEELYPDHKDRAIGEFSDERLRSYYVKNPRVMCPAIEAMREAKRLLDGDHNTAAVVFYGIGIELLLKATILRPVVMGLVHMESMAELVVTHAIAKDGYGQYLKLLNQIFIELVGKDLGQIKRPDVSQTLWEEASKVRGLRNDVVHKGEVRTREEAEFAKDVSWAVYRQFVLPTLRALGLRMKEFNGEIGDL